MSFTITNGEPRQQYEAGEPLTEQGAASTTDVDFIIDQFTRTGVLRHAEQYEATYGEFLSGDLYELAQTKIAEANTFYNSLPEGIRQNFPGGTQQFLEFSQDPSNIDAMKELGLPTSHLEGATAQPVPTPAPAPETPPESLSEPLSGNGDGDSQ